MNKKFINGLLLATLMVGTAGCFTSCKDYDDDINDLQGQINNIKASVDELKAIVAKGGVITGVTSTSDGFVFTMSDGKTVTVYNGKDGAQGPQGEPGKNGTVWTIGSDGYWYCDGVKTDNLAVPKAGAAGEAGKPGENGKYYVPNEETGKFDIYQDGKLIEATDISWVAAGPTASFDGTTLILSNLKDADGKTLDPVKIQVGITLTSIAVIPEVYTQGLPTVTFTTLANKSINVAKTDAGANWKTGDPINVSNEVVVNYRKNPADAFVAPSASVAYVDRGVTGISKAAGDAAKLLSGSLVESTDEDAIAVSTSINLAAYNAYTTPKEGTAKDPIAALQLTNGQNVFTSDYIYVKHGEVTAVLVDKAKTAAGKMASAYTKDLMNITRNLKTDETSSDYIKSFGSANVEIAFELGLDDVVDLSTFPALYVAPVSPATEGDFLTDLGFNDVTYKFSLPETFLGADGITNQQYFVTLNGDNLSVNPAIGGLTQAIGRTPAVRIDAYVAGNLIQSAFIKIKIVNATGSKDDLNITIPTVGSADLSYPTIAAEKGVELANKSKVNQKVAELTWQDINRDIYGALGLTSVSFDNNYNKPTVTVSIPVQWTENKTVKTGTAVYDMTSAASSGNGTATTSFQNTNLPGLYVNCDLAGKVTTTTSPIEVYVNNLIHTQDGTINNAVGSNGKTLGTGTVGFAGDAATYNIEIVYAAKDPTTNGDVVITKTVTVNEPHNALIYSNFVSNNTVTSYGALDGSNYKIMFQLANAFKRGDNNQDIFTFFKNGGNIQNVTGITITDVTLPRDKDGNALAVAITSAGDNNYVTIPAKPTDAGYAAACAQVRAIRILNDQVANLPLTATVGFNLELANGETCAKDYELTINFNNPFVGTTGTTLTLNGNAPLAAPLNVQPSLLVNDHIGQTIYSWVKTKDAVVDPATGSVTTPAQYGLELSEIAKANTGYAIDKPVTVTYAFDKDSQDYINGMAAGKLEVSTDGKVNYVPGAVLVEGKTLTIEATATFSSGVYTVSTVVCKIPLNITTGNN